MVDAYLLDTSIASILWDGHHRHHDTVRQKIAALGEASISVCSITLGEVEYGLQVSQGMDVLRKDAVRHAMLQYHIWSIDQHTGPVFARLRGELFKKYSPRDRRGRLTKRHPEDLVERTSGRELGIQENDLWIVSVAVQYDLHLLTRDKRIQPILEIANEAFGYDRWDIWDLP